ncbi:metallophosphoesterase family protein [Paenibacillus sp. L3-i20]|uniref:metallophosphoesterase family protein n=1 Tax=Paenibacillus sp. L3-i20 TaxID=2905833 RepID=UPI001EE06D04|nr:metallophosphoesterase family protein [Paenibacillus sp. L3-i20]GKU78412.1 serine/threonine protein phosphatase [Paenibacillus sp. L3-i20]
MKRTLMISDIHGCIDPFNDLLKKIEYDSSRDQLILIGDYVDRGPNSREVVDRVIDLVENHRVIALRGNHDQRFVDLVRQNSSEIQHKFMDHGGRETIKSYCSDIMTNAAESLESLICHIRGQYSKHISFLSQLPLHYEDEKHIYVHAGINPAYPNWKEQPDYDFMYIKGAFYQANLQLEKTVVFGHTRTVELHNSPNIWFGQGKIGIDGGCAYGLQLNCLIYEDGKYKTESIKR